MPGVADRAVARAVEAAKTRARDDVDQLIRAGLAVLRRDGAADMTIADVLAEAGLSTRAFYRHFTSKSDLLLAIYDLKLAEVGEAILRAHARGVKVRLIYDLGHAKAPSDPAAGGAESA